MTKDQASSPQPASGVAVIGMAGRFPGAPDVERFWKNLCAGVESIASFTREELLEASVPPALLDDPRYVRANGVLDGIELFDAAFFGFSPREAEVIDPQHRVFLETAWEALEDAGHDPERFAGLIGVFAGSALNTYLIHHLLKRRESPPPDEAGLLTGIDKDYLTTIVSYKLGLKGPSIGVQTFCSTSLVAVHLACQSLLAGESDLALAGGVSIVVPQRSGYLHEEGSIVSPDGHCRAFDAAAAGTVFGNGAGIVVLRRLEDAVRDGDSIRAVIRASTVNNDGARKVGFLAPAVDGQAEVIAETLAAAGVDPKAIGYIESHGTGTPLGDPVEVTALTRAFRGWTDRTGFCALGSVKTNIGHLNTAAGVAGLIKTVLALERGRIPPSLHYRSPNPAIDFAGTPFYVSNRLIEWPRGATPRRAAVSSFGFGGTNAHVVLEEAPLPGSVSSGRSHELLVLSARTPTALQAAGPALARHLEEHPDLELADVAWTLQVGRKAFSHRTAVVCATAGEAVSSLKECERVRVRTGHTNRRDSPVIFLFPGQGAQREGMARELFEHEPGFRQTIDRCAEILVPHLRVDLRDVLFGADDDSGSALDETRLAQPAIFAIEYALARLWMEWGIQPAATIGHSIGEYVAATIGGCFSLEDALALVAARGSLMQQAPRGCMLAIGLSEDETARRLDPALALAAVNGPAQCVVSGPEAAVAALEARLTRDGIEHARLRTSHAFHSALVDDIVGPFTSRVRATPRSAPAVPWLSNLTGTWIRSEEAVDPAYWGRHLRETVRFGEAIRRLFENPRAVLLEVGPGETLSNLVRRNPGRPQGQDIVASLPRSERSDVAAMMSALAELWIAGVTVNWAGVHAHERRRRVPLPRYPFERQRYWVEPESPVALGGQFAKSNPPREETSCRIADPAAWFHAPRWVRSHRPAAADGEQEAEWLVFADEHGLGDALAGNLRNRPGALAMIRAGRSYSRKTAHEYVVNPERREDYEKLAGSLNGQGPLGIVHLWNLTGHTRPPADDELETFWRRGFYSLLHLVQVFGHQRFSRECRITVITDHGQEVTGDELLIPEKAAMVGVVRVAPQEYPRIRCRLIDVVLPARGSPRETGLVSDLVGELAAAFTGELVAYRGTYRWVLDFEPLRPASNAPSVRRDGVYLITGGLGRVGLALATELAAAGGARLALVARKGHPARNTATAKVALAGRTVSGELVARADRLETRSAELERELGIRHIDEYPNLEPALRELAAGLIVRYFASAGMRPGPGERHAKQSLRERLGIRPEFHRFFDFFLRVLAEAGLVRLDGEEFEFQNDVAAFPAPEAIQARLELAFPEFTSLFRLLAHCAREYPRALRGDIDAISVLYPDGTPSELLVAAARVPVAFSDQPARTALLKKELVELAARTGHRPFRVLEIGAGNGSLTEQLAAALSGVPVEYFMTDLGSSFVKQAERDRGRFGLPQMHFRVLDVSRDPRDQGFEPHRFDAVVGFDVVHATPAIGSTLRNLRTLLRPGGMLYLVEGVKWQPWVDMVWGLAGGWWAFEDGRAARNSPLLAPAEWEHALEEQGFVNALALPRDPSRRERTDYGLVIGQSPGESLDPFLGSWWVPGDDETMIAMEREQRIEALRALGAEVLVLSADVGDRAALRAAVEATVRRFGRIDGVIHAAGVVDAQSFLPLEETSREAAARQLYPKVQGTRALEAVLEGYDLDFCLLVSSLSAVLGGLGHGSYAAANAYLDAFAARHNRGGRVRWQSVGWEAWRFAPREVDRPWFGATLAELAITPREGMEVFRRAVGMLEHPHLVISSGNLARRIREWSVTGEAPPTRVAAEPAARSRYARPALTSEFVAPRNDVEAWLVELWEELLGVHPIGISDNFLELGGDSLLATRVVARIRDRYRVHFPLRSLIEGGPIVRLAAEVLDQQLREADPGLLEEIVGGVEGLSDDEARRELQGPPP